MGDIVLNKDVGSLGILKNLSAPASATAAGSGDSSSTTGRTIDRAGFSGGLPGSLDFAVVYEAVLQTGKTLSVGYAVQDSADNSNWSDYQTATYAAVATGSTAASPVAGELNVKVNLGSARRYVRTNFAVDLSATGTDTAVARAVGFLAGFDRPPSQ